MPQAMNDSPLSVRLMTEMALILRPTPPNVPPGPALDGLLTGMLEVFARGSGAARAAVVLLEPGDETPRIRAVVPEAGSWPGRGEGLREFLRPGPPRFRTASEAVLAGAKIWLGGPPGPSVAVAALPAEDFEPIGKVRGALVAEIDAAAGVAAMPGAAVLLARAVEMGGVLAAERAGYAAETVSLRGRVSAGFDEMFGPRGCPGLAGLRTLAEQAARENGPVLLWGEAGTGKARLARLIHEVAPRAAKPFTAASLRDPAAIFGVAGNGFSRPGAVEDAAGGCVYLADMAMLAGRGVAPGHSDALACPDIPDRLVRLAADGRFSRLGSAATRHSKARLILGSTLPPEELVREVPALAPVLPAVGGDGGPLRVIRLPALRERPGDVPVLLQRAVALLGGRSGTRPSLAPRAVKALAAYSWPGNDAEVETLVSEALLSRSGERLDVGDLPSRVFSLGPGSGVAGEMADVPSGADSRRDAPGVPDTLWDMERARMIEALSRHGWVKARAARELGLTPRQLAWRMKRHGLGRPTGG